MMFSTFSVNSIFHSRHASLGQHQSCELDCGLTMSTDVSLLPQYSSTSRVALVTVLSIPSSRPTARKIHVGQSDRT